MTSGKNSITFTFRNINCLPHYLKDRNSGREAESLFTHFSQGSVSVLTPALTAIHNVSVYWIHTPDVLVRFTWRKHLVTSAGVGSLFFIHCTSSTKTNWLPTIWGNYLNPFYQRLISSHVVLLFIHALLTLAYGCFSMFVALLHLVWDSTGACRWETHTLWTGSLQWQNSSLCFLPAQTRSRLLSELNHVEQIRQDKSDTTLVWCYNTEGERCIYKEVGGDASLPLQSISLTSSLISSSGSSRVSDITVYPGVIFVRVDLSHYVWNPELYFIYNLWFMII